jgi:hypothetical protein
MGDTLDVTVSKLWGFVREIATDYWGPNKDNGKRSMVLDHEKRLDSLEAAMKHFIDADRAKTCPIKPMLDEHKKDHDDEVEDETEMRKTRENNRTLIVQQWVQIAGLIIVALIGLYGK